MENIEIKSNEKIGPLKPVQWLFLLLCLGFAWRALFIYRDVAWITNYWLFEDFGYSLKIAKNIALGLGETFDGVVPTNGYQPLYVWLMVPVFWIFNADLITPIYIAVTLLATANVATGIFIYSILFRLTGTAKWALLGVAFWMFNIAIVKDGTNGLEAGFSTMMVAATLAYYFKIDRLDRKIAIGLGLLLGLSFLARVDAVFLIAAIFSALLFRNTGSLKEKTYFGIIAGLSLLVVAAPYVIWNLLNFGSPLPTSGQVTTGKSSLFDFSGIGISQLINNVEYGLYIFFRMLSGAPSINGWVAQPSQNELWMPKAALALLLLPLLACAANKPKQDYLNTLFLYTALLLYFYGYTIYSFVAFERYFLPAVLIFTIAFIFSIHSAIGKTRKISSIILAGLIALIFTSFIAKGINYYKNNFNSAFGWFHGTSELNTLASPGDVVAAFQTGNLGYFYKQGRAINLDGVVNLDALKARKNGDLDYYLQENNVRYLADEGGWVFNAKNGIPTQDRRDRFLASLKLIHKSPDYEFNIYEISKTSYLEIRKINDNAWEKKNNENFISGTALFSKTPGSKVSFTSSRCFDLKFLKHNRSGIANIYMDKEKIRTIDLYSEIEDSTWKELFLQDNNLHFYDIVISNNKNPLSHGTEIWIDAVLERDNCKQAGIN